MTVASTATAENGHFHGSSLYRDATTSQGNVPDFGAQVAAADLIATTADDEETLDDAGEDADAGLSAEDAHGALLAEERYLPAATCGSSAGRA